MGVIVSDIEAINIDRPIDFLFAEFLMRNYDRFKKECLV